MARRACNVEGPKPEARVESRSRGHRVAVRAGRTPHDGLRFVADGSRVDRELLCTNG
jgi:hypothetical protein